MSPQPDCGKGFVVSFVAASNDAGSLALPPASAWKDGVAGAFSGAFSGMKAKGFFADEAGAGAFNLGDVEVAEPAPEEAPEETSGGGEGGFGGQFY